MMTTIYHNPSCSKSRGTLELLSAHGETPEVVEYLLEPPSPVELGRILDLLGIGPRELMRAKEPRYRELGLDDPELSREALIAAMVENPRLIERPIVVKDGRAAIGRPPETVLSIL